MSFGKKGFLMTDGLVCIFIVSIMVLLVLGTVRVHVGIYDDILEQAETFEEKARYEFSITERCGKACEIEEDLSS